jgi:tetratricopeptide (TPR) repeat protein
VKRPVTPILAATILLLALFGAAAVPAWRPALWGSHAWTFLPVAVLAAVALVAAVVGMWLAATPARLPRGIAATAGMLAAGLVFFYLLRDRTHLLGDGRLWIAVLGEERVYHPHEPLAFGAALLATGGPAGAPAAAIAGRLEIWSVFLGGAALFLMLRLAARLAREDAGRRLAFGLLAAAGTLQFGIGYVEAYPVLWVAVLLFLVLGLDAMRTDRSPVPAALAFGLAVGVHALAILLLPAFLVMMRARRRPPRAWAAAVPAALVVPAFSYGVLPFLLPTGHFSSGGLGFSARRWGELLSGIHLYRYGPAAWALEQVNRWTLAAGAAPLLLLAGMALRLARIPRPGTTPGASAGDSGDAAVAAPDADDSCSAGGREALFLGVAAAGLAAPALLLDTGGSRGAAADWDAFAVAAVPLAALAACWWAPAGASSRGARRALALAIALGLFGTLSFVVLNASPGPAVRRLEMLATHTFRTPRARSWAFESLALYRRNQGEMNAAADFYSRALADQPENVRLLRNAAAALSRVGRAREAAVALGRLTALHPDDAPAWLHLGLELEAAGAADSAAIAFREALRIAPRSTDAMNELARLLLESPAGRPEACRLLRRSLALQPQQTHAAEMEEVRRRLAADGYCRGD